MGVKITYFVHGTTTDNEKGLATGWNDGELSPIGIKQSQELGKLVKGKKFDAIFCSDLKRAIDSANLTFNNQPRIIKDRRLREINYGGLNGTPGRDFKNRLDQFIAQPFPNGESYLDVEKRLSDFLQDLNKNYNNQAIAIVAHQAPQLALEVLLKNKSWPKAIAEDWRQTGQWQPGWEYTTS